MDSVDMEAWEASQRRVVRTRWLPTPSGRFLEGRKLAASLALHLHQAAPVASAASLAAMCAAVAERQSLRGSFGQETINAVAHRLLLLEASSLIPWLPVYVHLLHHPFALQGQLAEHLAVVATHLLHQPQQEQKQEQESQHQEQEKRKMQQAHAMDRLVQQTLHDADSRLLGRLHHPSLLPTRLLLQICGGLLAAVQAYEMPLSLARLFFDRIAESMKSAAAFRSDSNSSSMPLLPLRDVAFFFSALKQSGLVEEKVTHLLLLQVQQDLIQLEKTCLAEAPAPKAAEATETGGLATTIEAEAAEDVDPSPPPATGSATATAAPAAAEAEQLLTAAEGSVADMCVILDAAAFNCRTPAAAAAAAAGAVPASAATGDFAELFDIGWRLMLFNAMAAEGSPMILSTEDYQDALREFLSSNADLDPEALGSLSL
ncbi:uncharacterized protein LOC34620550 [Cyclospora cayetanensis]|uniref:Uncharacterized protein LOC34620550 n=1 Tax=Cyclospora cayetanensis TaxID=88456 RepID=A0A6P6RT19_9EIME|nr:uncharacterized protein LOC34620550 [Cyclospora cayetanensis]